MQVLPRNKKSSKVLSLEGTSLNFKREFVKDLKLKGVKRGQERLTQHLPKIFKKTRSQTGASLAIKLTDF